MDNKILEVKDLKISFKTSSGKVQAVRNINFELNKGETLAIVGESGSGKSVTSKAIMGIYSNNAIIEGGEILYDGQDLLKIDEKTFQNLRGNKIAMIFQDPMSSLNPIVKIGKQLTEAMIIKEKQAKKESRKLFNKRLYLLEQNMYKSLDKNLEEEIKQVCKQFKIFSYHYLQLQKKYNRAYHSAQMISKIISEISLEVSKQVYTLDKSQIVEIYHLAFKTIHEHVVFEDKNNLELLLKKLKTYIYPFLKKDYQAEIIETIIKINEIVNKALLKQSPNYFAMSYYLSFENNKLPQMEVNELNVYLENYLNDNYLKDFMEKVKKALIFSTTKNIEEKKIAKEALENSLKLLEDTNTNDKKQLQTIVNILNSKVNKAINHLDLRKNTQEYVFGTTIKNYLKIQFNAKINNQREEKRFKKEKEKIDKIINKGKIPEWKPIPASIIDIDLVKKNIIGLIKALIRHYDEDINNISKIDFNQLAADYIEELKNNASKVVFTLNKKMIKERAINILEEVGISEPRKRYNQYPFEFSGGMRQRIVIAIALVANPDILICDEPTTALDVTIQATILELINKLKEERKLSVIFITHDLGVVANMADKVAVMYAGKIVEIGGVNQIFYNPRHPYTWALLSSMPDLETNERLEAIHGTPPNMIYPPKGDAFAPRNKYALEIDFLEEPPMFKVEEGHYAATWLLHENAPQIEIPKSILARVERMRKESGSSGE